MNLFSRMKVGRRLAIAFGLCISLLLAISVTAMQSLQAINESLQLVVEDRYAKVKLINHAVEEVNKQARFARNVVIFEQPQERAAEIKAIDASRAETARIYDVLTPTIRTAEGKKMLDAVTREREVFRDEMAAFTKLAEAGNLPQARTALLERVRVAQLAYMKGLDDFIRFQEKLMEQAAAEATREVSSSLWMVGVAALLALVSSVLAGVVLTRSITRPLGQAVAIAESVAAGDLSSEVKVEGGGETAQMLRALQRMNQSLVKIVTDVRGSSESIATGSAQIATGNADLSQRTEEQASNLQQTAASMEQLTSTVQNNADTARQASQLAGGASEVAAQGGVAVERVVATMHEITDASRRIADIIGVIDGIAFQTNILALNAAVEAARAGEQGRGFAVVAGEVRNLAQRAASAAKEIKTLIGSSVDKIEAGSAQAGEAGRTMNEIVAQVKRVSDLISEISAASVEQSSGIGQIGQAVTQLDQVTQQNAALVEESAAAADSLKHQAARLADTVAVFRLAGHGALAAA